MLPYGDLWRAHRKLPAVAAGRRLFGMWRARRGKRVGWGALVLHVRWGRSGVLVFSEPIWCDGLGAAVIFTLQFRAMVIKQ